MAHQNIVPFKVKDLHLWSENPRDPVDGDVTDYDLIKRALIHNPSKWNLKKMVEEMGPHYDFSELPTVVLDKGRALVYDGNRRIAVLKYLQDQVLYSKLGGGIFFEFEPESLKSQKIIPCNVCDRETALINIERKHVNSGTWGPLERDYFLTTHRKQNKSLFVQFEEQTEGAISQHKKMNQGFVKKEVLTDRNLKEIGINLDSHRGLVSNYSNDEVQNLVEKIVSVVNSGKIATRGKNRGKLKDTIIAEFPEMKSQIKVFDSAKPTVAIKIKGEEAFGQRKTPRTRRDPLILFGGDLFLRNGVTNDLYRDILDLYKYYEEHKVRLSKTFPSFIRMVLRLLVESATSVKGGIDEYITANFLSAKNKLTQDQKTLLSSHNINQGKLVELLHTGAHNYSSSSNMDQTIAISIIIGEMLKQTHSRA